jgi:hypothetical protein
MGYLTSKEQVALSRRSSQESIKIFVKAGYHTSEKERRKLDFSAQQMQQYSDANPIRDLEMLAQDGENIASELRNIKKTYNELVAACISRNPEFMNLVWQFYRRTHKQKVESFELISIVSGNDDLEKAMATVKKERPLSPIMPFARTDKERVVRYKFNLRIKDEDLAKEPVRRLVERDSYYFWGTGRFAFANGNNDIFQTLWDERQNEFPLFDLN